MRKTQMLTVLFCVVSTAFTVAAQTPPLLLSVARVQVKPDRVGEFMDVEKQYSAAFKKGGGTIRVVYRNVAGNPFEFMVVSTMPNYAIQDDKSFYAKGATEAELARMAARRNQCVESVRTTYERTQPDLGFNPPGTPQPKTVTMVRVNVHPDMIQQWMATVKNELVPAWKKAGQPGMLARRVEYGGSRNQFTIRVPLNKWADLDGEGPLVKALGQDGAAKLGAKLSSMSSAEWLVYNFVPELSVRPPQ
jgi:hypothetical protein